MTLSLASFLVKLVCALTDSLVKFEEGGRIFQRQACIRIEDRNDIEVMEIQIERADIIWFHNSRQNVINQDKDPTVKFVDDILGLRDLLFKRQPYACWINVPQHSTGVIISGIARHERLSCRGAGCN